MAVPKILEENERGQTRVEGNALIQDSLIDDAAEMRVGGPNGGKFSLDVVQRDENGKILSRRAIAEVTCGEGVFGAEFTISVLKKGGQSVDSDMVKAIRITEEGGIEFLLPITGGGTVSGTPPNELRAPGGVYWLAIQDSDGNFVAYKNRVPFDYTTGEPYWASGTVNP